MNIKSTLVHSLGAFATLFATFGLPSNAEAGQCSVSCTYTSCSVKALFKKVYCICTNGYAQCGSGYPSLKAGQTGGRALPNALTAYLASDDQLRELELYIDRAEALRLTPVEDAAWRIYEAILTSNPEAYEDALTDHDNALSELSDPEWDQLTSDGDFTLADEPTFFTETNEPEEFDSTLSECAAPDAETFSAPTYRVPDPGASDPVPPGAVTGVGPKKPATWTVWLNRDLPDGSGDWETLGAFVNHEVCPNPSAIECQTSFGVDWAQTGEIYTCNPSVGGICKNADQPDGKCQNYKVRFLCP